MQILVNKSEIRDAKISDSPETAALGAGQAHMKINHFALTANNITYAVAGDFLKYWDFFPAEEGYGIVPVWGFADVVASNCDGIEVGTRYYGYYPMGDALTVEPIEVSDYGFSDGVSHRKGLARVYNRYLKTDVDPAYAADTEDLQMIYRPLFGTAFLIDDFIADNDFFGVKKVIFSSASSKTAYSTAFLTAKRDGITLVGLTSPGNVGYVKDLEFYDEVVAYDDIEKMDASEPVVYVDMAGNVSLRGKLHHHFKDNMKYSCSVGLSHWDQNGPQEENLPGAKPTMFFAPSQSEKRVNELGAAEFQNRFSSAWNAFLEKASGWVEVRHEEGPEALIKNYQAFLDGSVPANLGLIHKL
jgi:hypothetical protein